MRLFSVILPLTFFPSSLIAENYSELIREMENVSVETVVIPDTLNSILEPLFWFEDGKSLGVNFKGEWTKFTFQPPLRRDDRWAGGPVGRLTNFENPVSLNNDEVLALKAATSLTGERQLMDENGTMFEMVTTDQLNELVVRDENGAVTTTFSLGYNRCHSLSLAPGKHLIAYICNGMGILISKLE